MTQISIYELQIDILDHRRQELDRRRRAIISAEMLAKCPFEVDDIVECSYGRDNQFRVGMRKSTLTMRRYKVTKIRTGVLTEAGYALTGRQVLADGRLSDFETDLKWKRPRKVEPPA